MERFKIYNILHHDHLGQISLALTEDNNCLEDLFGQLDERGVKIKFLVFQQEKDGFFQLTFCVEKGDLKATQKTLSHLSLKDEAIYINPKAGMVAIYGPHFVERPGIVDAMHQALSSQGVKILAISTTVSTSFFVIPATQVILATDILREAFEIPQGKG